jgi:hypothetical protein
MLYAMMSATTHDRNVLLGVVLFITVFMMRNFTTA